MARGLTLLLKNCIIYLQCWARIIFLSTHHVSPGHAVLPTCYSSLQCFFDHFHAPLLFRVTRHFFYRAINIPLLKLVLTPTYANSPFLPLPAVILYPSSGGQIHPFLHSGHPPPLLPTSPPPPPPPPPPPLMEMVGRGGRRVKGRQGHKETGEKETGDRETDRKTGDRQGTDRETGGGNKKDPPTTEMLVITDIFSSCRPTTSHF